MSESVFVFKVALYDAKKIWHRIAIRGDQTLHDLHGAIYDAFHHDDVHLYSFYFLHGQRRACRKSATPSSTRPPCHARSPMPSQTRSAENRQATRPRPASSASTSNPE